MSFIIFIVLLLLWVYIGAETQDKMAMSSICLPEPLQHDDTRSWFKRFELYAAANEWNTAKQLLHFPTLLQDWSWVIYELLSDADKATYNKLKKAILDWLDPDMDERHLAAWGQLSQRSLHGALMSWPETWKSCWTKPLQGSHQICVKLSCVFISLTHFPDNVAFQLKLQPQANYSATISKAWELQLIYTEKVAALIPWAPYDWGKISPRQSGAVTTTGDRTTGSSK